MATIISSQTEQENRYRKTKKILALVSRKVAPLFGHIDIVKEVDVSNFLDLQNTGKLEANDETGLVLRCNNGATKVLWEDIGFIFYNEDAFAAMIIKTHDLLEMGIDNRREHHEAIWQMVLRHCIGREDVKIDPHWQAFWEAHQQG